MMRKSPLRGRIFTNTQCDAAAESRSAWASTRKVRPAFDGERAETGNSRRTGAKNAASRAHFQEYTMRCSPPPRPARLGSPHAKYAPISTASAPNRESYICGSSEVNVTGHRSRSPRRRSPVGTQESPQPAARTLAEDQKGSSTRADADASRANTSCARTKPKATPESPKLADESQRTRGPSKNVVSQHNKSPQTRNARSTSQTARRRTQNLKYTKRMYVASDSDLISSASVKRRA